jgi:hypothetical protein
VVFGRGKNAEQQMKAFAGSCIVLFLILPIGTAASEPASDKIAEVRLIQFSDQKELPKGLEEEYRQLLADSEIAKVPPPLFSLSYIDLNQDGAKEVFVRVKSFLSCSASGQCEIDMFETRGGEYRKLFSAVAENIGLVEEPKSRSTTSKALPAIVTNIPVSADLALAKAPLRLDLSQGSTEWRWDGKSYQPVRSKAN